MTTAPAPLPFVHRLAQVLGLKPEAPPAERVEALKASLDSRLRVLSNLEAQLKTAERGAVDAALAGSDPDGTLIPGLRDRIAAFHAAIETIRAALVEAEAAVKAQQIAADEAIIAARQKYRMPAHAARQALGTLYAQLSKEMGIEFSTQNLGPKCAAVVNEAPTGGSDPEATAALARLEANGVDIRQKYGPFGPLHTVCTDHDAIAHQLISAIEKTLVKITGFDWDANRKQFRTPAQITAEAEAIHAAGAKRLDDWNYALTLADQWAQGKKYEQIASDRELYETCSNLASECLMRDIRAPAVVSLASAAANWLSNNGLSTDWKVNRALTARAIGWTGQIS